MVLRSVRVTMLYSLFKVAPDWSIQNTHINGIILGFQGVQFIINPVPRARWHKLFSEIRLIQRFYFCQSKISICKGEEAFWLPSKNSLVCMFSSYNHLFKGIVNFSVSVLLSPYPSNSLQHNIRGPTHRRSLQWFPRSSVLTLI